MNVKELYKDPSKTKQYWETSWGSRDYEKMIQFELRSFSQRVTVDKFIEECNISGGDSVLDIGCGWGRISISMLKRLPNLSVYGVDVSEEAIGRGRKLVKDLTGQTADLQTASAESLPFEDHMFDAVVSTRVWQYVTDPQRATNEVCRVLREGGRTTIMAPNARNPVRARSYHTQLLTVEQIGAWMSNAGLKIMNSGTILFAPPKKIPFTDRSSWVRIEHILEHVPWIRQIGGLAWVSAQKA